MAYAGHWQASEGAERRSEERRILLLETEGETARGGRAEVTVHNISEGGLLIETAAALAEGEEIAIVLPQAGAVLAVVRWSSGRLHGCEFAAPIGSAALAAAELRSVPANAPPAAGGAPLADAGFAARLQRLRKTRGLTLAQIAEALGVSKPTVWAWEQGRSRPVESRIAPLIEILGVDHAELFPDAAEAGALDGLIARLREEIASAAGTSATRVRIMIEL